ncbi:hypothetical protein EIP86_006268 [Pleurotus ostreatoroseus]|nr:hypothetical protein EIP86_006268 [Pleurotus ostreatoroseus]
MASSTTPTTIAKAPFDEDSVDSVVLRTSDLVDFYVIKAVLGLASPFFKDMFSLAQPHTDQSLSAAKEPIIVSEKSDTIDCLFRLCYPIDDPVIEDLDLVERALAAAIKYQMGEATKLLSQRFTELITNHTCKHAFGISCRLNLEEQARQSADTISRMIDYRALAGLSPTPSATVDGGCYDPKMAPLSAGSYFRLLQYIRTHKAIPMRSYSERLHSRLQQHSERDTNGAPTFCTLPPEPLQTLSETATPSIVHMGDADTDLLLRTSDGVDVTVHSVILRLASADKLLQLPRVVDAASTFPVIQLNFEFQVLRALLELCYPLRSPRNEEVGPEYLYLARRLLQVAKQYDIPRIADAVKQRIMQNYVKTDPLLVYFLSVEQVWQDVAVAAAQSTVYLDIEDTYHPWMELLPAVSYYNLLDYRRRYQITLVKTLCKYPSHLRKWEDIKLFLSFSSTESLLSSDNIRLMLLAQGSAVLKEVLDAPSGPKQRADVSRFRDVVESFVKDTEVAMTQLSQQLIPVRLNRFI